MTVTRTEIADVMAGALGRGSRSADEIVSFAVAAGARPEVVAQLRGLPQRSYSHLRDLWPELADVPVEV
jgi:hypothetical protein